jgi:hypothetical protein
MKTLHTVEEVRGYFRENYGHIDLWPLSNDVIYDFLNQGYIVNLSFERQMDSLYDYILSQGLCDVEE